MLCLAFAPGLGALLCAVFEVSVHHCLVALLASLVTLGVALRRRQMLFLCAWFVLFNSGTTRVAMFDESPRSPPASGTHTFKVIKNSEAASFISPERVEWTRIEIQGQVIFWRVPKNMRVRMGNRYRSKIRIQAIQVDLNGGWLERIRSRLRPAAWIAVSDGPTVLVERADGIGSAIDDRRVLVAQAMAKVWQGNYLGVALALALGTRGALPESLQRQWNDMGISHLLAISGLHMGLVGLFLFYLTRLAGSLIFRGKRGSVVRRVAALHALMGMWLFCLWVGSPVSATRACLMGTVLLGAMALRLSRSGFNALGVAGIVMTLDEPECLLSIGAWLSFGCTWFLLLAARRPRPAQVSWFSSWFTMTTVPWLATLPLCALCFGELYFWGVPANLFAIAFASWLITPAALLGALCTLVGIRVPEILEWMLIVGIDSIQTLLGFFLSTGWTRLQVSWATACLLSVIVWPWLIAWLRGSLLGGIKAAVPGFLLALLTLLWSTFHHQTGLQVYMPYVGHGDATLVEFTNGEVMLIDAGGAGYQSRSDPGERTVAPLLRKRGHTHLEYVVMSHPDNDHIGGLDYILSRFSVGEFWLDAWFLDHVRVKPLVTKVKRMGGRIRTFQDLPDFLEVGSATVELVYPRRVAEHQRYVSTNQRSLVFRIEERGRSILFTGDVDTDVENFLVPVLKPTQVLKVAHHGSNTSSSQAFLNAVKPCLAAVSSGRRSRGQFPHPQVVKRYLERGTVLAQNSLSGALKLSATSTGWRVHSVLEEPRDVKCTAQEPIGSSVRLGLSSHP